MLLGLDLGTGSLKALLLNENGQVIAETSRAYTVYAPQPGWAESNPNDWWSAAQEATLELGRGDEITAIGFSGQMHGVVLSNAKGQALRDAILWADGRSSSEVKTYKNLESETLQRLANPLVTGMAGMSLLWLKRHEPELLKSAQWAFQPKDWLRYQLTGEAFADPSDASGTLLYDLERDTWALDVMGTLELPQTLLAPLRGSSEMAGTLSSTAANQLGLRAGIPIAMGGGDTPTAMFGSGLLKPRCGAAFDWFWCTNRCPSRCRDHRQKFAHPFVSCCHPERLVRDGCNAECWPGPRVGAKHARLNLGNGVS
jgi:xylulokinase